MSKNLQELGGINNHILVDTKELTPTKIKEYNETGCITFIFNKKFHLIQLFSGKHCDKSKESFCLNKEKDDFTKKSILNQINILAEKWDVNSFSNLAKTNKINKNTIQEYIKSTPIIFISGNSKTNLVLKFILEFSQQVSSDILYPHLINNLVKFYSNPRIIKFLKAFFEVNPITINNMIKFIKSNDKIQSTIYNVLILDNFIENAWNIILLNVVDDKDNKDFRQFVTYYMDEYRPKFDTDIIEFFEKYNTKTKIKNFLKREYKNQSNALSQEQKTKKVEIFIQNHQTLDFVTPYSKNEEFINKTFELITESNIAESDSDIDLLKELDKEIETLKQNKQFVENVANNTDEKSLFLARKILSDRITSTLNKVVPEYIGMILTDKFINKKSFSPELTTFVSHNEELTKKQIKEYVKELKSQNLVSTFDTDCIRDLDILFNNFAERLLSKNKSKHQKTIEINLILDNAKSQYKANDLTPDDLEDYLQSWIEMEKHKYLLVSKEGYHNFKHVSDINLVETLIEMERNNLPKECQNNPIRITISCDSSMPFIETDYLVLVKINDKCKNALNDAIIKNFDKSVQVLHNAEYQAILNNSVQSAEKMYLNIDADNLIMDLEGNLR